MRNTIFAGVSVIATATLRVVGCASNNMPTQSEYSGFLREYFNLQQTKDPDGETSLRYVNPNRYHNS